MPVIALDPDRIDGDPGLRLCREGETLGRARPLSARQIVIADGSGPVAIVLGEVSPDAGRDPERRARAALRPQRGRSSADRGGGGALDRG